MLVLSELFTPTDLEVLQQAAAGLDFEDGSRTAGPMARRVKANQQATDSADSRAVLAMVEAALMRHPVFRAAARPKTFLRLMVSRYQPGHTYGAHVDDAIMAGGRSDLSFTLFLSDPDTYSGGELVIDDRFEDRAIKLPPGEAIVYASTTLHRVAPVSQGTRLAVVGWVQSLLRDPAQRDLMMDLDAAIAHEDATKGDAIQLGRLQRTRSNLLRMWAQ
ncbi:MAG: Fe2+-dependent dioxygenase [Rhodobacteraceae bacterium]|nr:Fe2+-dependent dioxygenase [Paracoccaceae bacterium]